MKTNGTLQNIFFRLVLIPIKALGKARDFYVRSMINCSERITYGGINYGGIGEEPLSSSFSRSSSSSSYSNDKEDFVELVRVASGKGGLGDGKIDVELYLRQHQMMMMQKNNGGSVGGSRKMPRSGSVVMGKIDEDEPYVLGRDSVADVKMQMKFPRSRSHAPYTKSVVL